MSRAETRLCSCSVWPTFAKRSVPVVRRLFVLVEQRDRVSVPVEPYAVRDLRLPELCIGLSDDRRRALAMAENLAARTWAFPDPPPRTARELRSRSLAAVELLTI